MIAFEKAKALGAKIDGRANWDWAYNFPTREAADQFVKWLEENGYEHRGVYQDEDPVAFSVRFRK